MQTYIDQIIADIRQAKFNLNIPYELRNISDYDICDNDNIDDFCCNEYYSREKESTIAQITGIEPCILPPPVKLNEEQMAVLSKELEGLLYNNNFRLEFPHNYPYHLRYPFFINFWKEKHIPQSFGLNEIILCIGIFDACPFGRCNICQDIEDNLRWEEDMIETENMEMINAKKMLEMNQVFDIDSLNVIDGLEKIKHFYSKTYFIPYCGVLSLQVSESLDHFDDNVEPNDINNQCNFDNHNYLDDLDDLDEYDNDIDDYDNNTPF